MIVGRAIGSDISSDKTSSGFEVDVLLFRPYGVILDGHPRQSQFNLKRDPMCRSLNHGDPHEEIGSGRRNHSLAQYRSLRSIAAPDPQDEL